MLSPSSYLLTHLLTHSFSVVPHYSSIPSSSSSASNLPPSSCFIPELQGSPPPSIPHCLPSFSFYFSFSLALLSLLCFAACTYIRSHFTPIRLSWGLPPSLKSYGVKTKYKKPAPYTSPFWLLEGLADTCWQADFHFNTFHIWERFWGKFHYLREVANRD
ncbi:hypothetical protein BO86DRAFT_233602 [Aspergillus japonicus CBS 114.51]|uniref:Uncharacterized protein n=1 Tax=Aspergillus japonicus CBS 114.51 TaxID=1448312 RepID=A0A8T8WN11_ASPJA|nr:hypothetical protein BO86DRAFT_233602 [Aspergillus japonicus CBS 114.51]RAH77083.1 hypothetical protein BO86DRAFT_233602 [Aspergillus japonicus CBS 114.51]